MRFGSQSTMVSVEALIAILTQVQGTPHGEVKIAAIALDARNSVWEATSRGLLVGRMGSVAQGVDTIEALHQMNIRAQQAITYEHRKICVNNRNIAPIHKLIEAARVNVALTTNCA
jgi:hypothetical protein